MKTRALAIAIVIAAVGLIASRPPARASATSSTCAASNPGTTSCSITAVYPADAVLVGYVSTESGAFTIGVATSNPTDPNTGRFINYNGDPCRIDPGTRTFPGMPGPPPGHFDTAHTTYSAAGPGEAALDFTPACAYTLTVTGTGAVGAGEVGEETAA